MLADLSLGHLGDRPQERAEEGADDDDRRHHDQHHSGHFRGYPVDSAGATNHLVALMILSFQYTEKHTW